MTAINFSLSVEKGLVFKSIFQFAHALDCLQGGLTIFIAQKEYKSVSAVNLALQPAIGGYKILLNPSLKNGHKGIAKTMPIFSKL